MRMHRWPGTHFKWTTDDLKEEDPLGAFFYLADDPHCRAHVVVGLTTVGLLAIPLRFGEPIGDPIEIVGLCLEVPLYQWRYREHTFSCQWRQICGTYPQIAKLYSLRRER